MNTASKLGPHTQTDRGTCPGVGLCVYFKSRYTTRGFDHGAQAINRGAARCASQVIDRGAHADARGAVKVMDRCAQADAHGATQVLDRGAQTGAHGVAKVLDCSAHAVARSTARCASQGI